MSTIQIDAFNTNLHSANILCQGPFHPNKYPPILESIEKLRDPFKKTVLLTSTPYSFGKGLPLRYDAIFHISDIQDWTHALTYCVHCPKPTLVVADDIEIPDAVWPRLTRGITFVHMAKTPIRNMKPYDCVFFAPIDDTTHSGFTEFVFRQLQHLYRASYSQKEYREIIQELKVASAGVAWSKYQEHNQTGAIYWYDAGPLQGIEPMSKKQLAELFQTLAYQFTE